MEDIQNALVREFKLTETEVREMLPSKRTTRFRCNVSWAATHMKKADLFKTPRRGQYIITKTGLCLLQSRPKRINIEMLSDYPAYKEWVRLSRGNNESKPKPEKENGRGKQTPDTIMEEEYRKLRGILAQNLLGRILEKVSYFFESLVVKLLVAMGYGGSLKEAAGMVVGKSGDEGIDGIIKEYKLGLDNISSRPNAGQVITGWVVRKCRNSSVPWPEREPQRGYSSRHPRSVRKRVPSSRRPTSRLC